MKDFKQIKPSIIGHSIGRSILGTDYGEYFAPGNDRDLLRTETVTGVNNILWKPALLLQKKFVNNNGTTSVAGVGFNVDTRGNAPLNWDYPSEFTVTPTKSTSYLYCARFNIQLRVGDYTSVTGRAKFRFEIMIDGIAQGMATGDEATIALYNSNNGVSWEWNLEVREEIVLTAGTHTIGYRYYQLEPNPIPGAGGYRHNLNQGFQILKELW